MAGNSGMTKVGAQLLLRYAFRKEQPPNFYIALCQDDPANVKDPSAVTATMADLLEVATGDGYQPGGFAITPGVSGFPTYGATTNGGYVTVTDVVFSASGGPLPSVPPGAKWAVLTDDNGTVSARKVLYWWDLDGEWSIIAGQLLNIAGLRIEQEPYPRPV